MSLPIQSTRTAATPFDAMDQEFDTMLTRLFNPPAVSRDNRVADYFVTAPVACPVDVREDADHLTVEAELPGFAKDEVDLTLENHVLTIAAQHKAPAPDAPAVATGGYLLNERRPARVQRSFKLPQTVGDQQVNATLENGVLTVTLAKRPESKARKINVG